jgi:O-antigen ligase
MSTSTTKVEQLFTNLGNLLCFIIPTIIISYPHSSQLMFVILLLSALHLSYLAITGKPKLSLEIWEKLIVFAWLQFFLVCLASMLISLDNRAHYDLPIEWLLAPLMFLSWRRLNLKSEFLYSGLIIALLASGIWAMYDVLILDKSRSEAGTDLAIAFANILLVMIAILLCGWHYWKVCKWSKLIVIIACSSGYIAILLSQTRSVWLAVPAVAAILIWFARAHLFKHKKFLSLAAIALIAATSLYVASAEHNIFKRMVAGINNTASVASNNKEYDLSSSMGERIELWQLGVQLFAQHPLVGVGYGRYRDILHERVANNHYSDTAMLRHRGPHNDIIQAMSEIGLFGLVSFLLFIILPLIAFRSQFKCNSANQPLQSYAISGILLITAFILFGLTDTSFTIKPMVHFYIFVVCCLGSLLRHKQLK